MSFQLPEPRSRLDRVVSMFLSEATDILDESVPFPRRVALLYKWSWVLRGLGYERPLEGLDVTEEELQERIRDMLRWTASVLLRTKSTHH